MSVIIRLQNLAWSASSVDIRKYFDGLSIPEGGVHIVGGEHGDAFIAFSTDEDARQAFERNNGSLKGVQINLRLSSRTEMQKVIEEARIKPFNSSNQSANSVLQLNKIPNAPQAPVITSTSYKDKQNLSPKREDIVSKSRSRDRDDSKSRDRDDSKGRRERSRRRSRSRSKSRDRKDRSRDRRDKRRRDRSRSRDRNNRRRDSRRRTRSRDRSRSKERDNQKSKDKSLRGRDLKPTEIIEIKDDQPPPKIWEQTPVNFAENASVLPSFLGNFPNPQGFNDARRSLGILASLQQQQQQNHNLPSQLNNRFQRNNHDDHLNNRDNNWQQRKNRFPDRNQPDKGDISSNHNMNQFQPNIYRPNLGNHMMNNDLRPNLFQNMNQNFNNQFAPNMRMKFNQMQQDERGFGMNRQFLARPGTVFPDQFRPDRNIYGMDPNNRMDDFRNSPKGGFCVLLRPFFGGYGELRKFFQGLFISNTGVKFVMDEDGKRTGIAYIRFVRSDGKEQALQRTGMMLRGCPVEVKHIEDEEWDAYNEELSHPKLIIDEPGKEEDNLQVSNETSLGPSSSILSQPGVVNCTCVVIDDLPEFVSESDILKMFSDYTILSVYMIVNNKYRYLAYVQFGSEEEANNAISDNKSHVISGKPVTVRPISDETFNEILHNQQQNGQDKKLDNLDENLAQDDQFVNNSQSIAHIVTDCVNLNGLPSKTSDRDILDFFSDIGIVPTKIHIMQSQFGPSGEAYCEFKNPDDAVVALEKNGTPLGSGTIRVELIYRRDMDRALGLSTAQPPPIMNLMGMRFPNRFGAPRGPHGLLGPRGLPPLRRRPNPNLRFDGPLDNMGPSGCVVNMENVPFKAGVNEILDFFENYSLSSHNVFRRFSDTGAPTGDARVTFNSPEEAMRAVEECHRLKIRDRTIFLRIV